MMDKRALEDRWILVVEDEFLIASDIVEAIRQLGGSVMGPCCDTAKAREALSKRGKPPDGAVLDLNLKGQSVVELAHDLADMGVALLYHTGYDTSIEQEGLPPGEMTRKPMSRAELMQRLATRIDGARQRPARVLAGEKMSGA